MWIINTRYLHWPLLEELLAWSPTVLVNEGALKNILPQGIKIDVVQAVSSSPEELRQKLVDQWPIECIPGVNNNSYLSAGLAYFLEKGYSTVSIIANPQSFWDTQAYVTQLELIFYFQDYKIVWITSGYWKKWLPQDTLLKLSSRTISTKNLAYFPDEKYYKVIKDGFVEIDTSDQGFWLHEKLGYSSE